MLRRPVRPHLRGRDRPVLRPGDELARFLPRPLPADLELRCAFAGQARARGHRIRLRPGLSRHPPGAGDRRGLCRHRRVLPGGGQVSHRRPPQMRCAADPRRRWRTAGAARCAASGSRSACCTGSKSWPTAARPRRRPRPPARSRAWCRCPRSCPSCGERRRSKTVERSYDRLVGTLGSELSILGEVPVEDIARADPAAGRGGGAAAQGQGDPRRRL